MSVLRAFSTDFCLSGACIFREYTMLRLEARACSNPHDRQTIERHADEVLSEAMRLSDEQSQHAAPDPESEAAPNGDTLPVCGGRCAYGELGQLAYAARRAADGQGREGNRALAEETMRRIDELRAAGYGRGE